MADKDLLSELRGLADEPQQQSASTPALPAETEQVIEQATIQSRLEADRKRIDAVRQSRGHTGAMGDSWGMLPAKPEDVGPIGEAMHAVFGTARTQSEWIEKEKQDAAQPVGVSDVAGKLTIGDYAKLALEMFKGAGTMGGAPMGRGGAQTLPDIMPTIAGAARRAGEAREKRIDAVGEMERGERDPALKNVFRAGLEQAATGVSDTLLASSVKAIGISQGIVARYLGQQDVKLDDNTAYALGQWIESKAHELFPGDPSRQEEFATKLSSGAGSMVGFMGPGAVSKLMGASDKMLLSLTAITGGTAEGASMFDQATQFSKEQVAKGGQPLEEWQRAMAFGVGLAILGPTEALPIASMLNRRGGGFARAVGREMFEEGAQEGGQQIGENLTANMLYDPEKGLGEGVVENTAVGAILGGKMQAARLAISKKARAAVREEDAARGFGPEAEKTQRPTPPTDDRLQFAGMIDATPRQSKRTPAGEEPQSEGVSEAAPEKASDPAATPAPADPQIDALKQFLSEASATVGEPPAPIIPARPSEQAPDVSEVVPQPGTSVAEQAGEPSLDAMASELRRSAEDLGRATVEQTMIPEDQFSEVRARDMLRDLIAGKEPSRVWGEKLGATPEQMQPLLQQAVSDGLIRIDRNGVIRRTAKSKAAEAARQPAPAAAVETGKSRGELTIAPGHRALKRAERVEKATGQQFTEAAKDYAVMLEQADSTTAAQVLDDIRQDKTVTKPVLDEILQAYTGEAKRERTKAAAFAKLSSLVRERANANGRALAADAGSLPEAGVPGGVPADARGGNAAVAPEERGPGSGRDVPGSASADDGRSGASDGLSPEGAGARADTGERAGDGESRVHPSPPLFRMTSRSADGLGSFRPGLIAKREEITAEIEHEIGRMLPPQVALQIADRIRIEDQELAGYYLPAEKLLKLALESGDNPKTIGWHETTHALRDVGAFTDEEWQTLVDRAKKVGVDERITALNEATSEEINAVPLYGRIFESRGRQRGYQGAGLAAFVDEQLNEERVAKLAESWAGGTRFGKAVDALLSRMVELLRAIKRALAAHGFETLADVFEAGEVRGIAGRMRSGDLAERLSPEATEARERERVGMMLATPEGEAALEMFGASRAARISRIQSTMRQEDVTALAVRDGAMFMFAGEKARTADHEALAKAQQMEGDGKGREDIWKQTGWFRGVDKRWRFEIDDRWMSARPGGDAYTSLAHPGVSRAYDREWVAGIHDEPAEAGSQQLMRSVSGNLFSEIHARGPTDASRRRTAGHELQHHVQDIERFAEGGTFESPAFADISRAERLAASLTGRDGDTLRSQIKAAENAGVRMDAIRELAYRMMAGEVEARTVEKRLEMTPDQRRSRPPWLDYDIPEDQQIVRFPEDDSGAKASARNYLSGTSTEREFRVGNLPGSVIESVKPDGTGIRTYKITRNDGGDPIGQMLVSEHADGRWEVGMIRVADGMQQQGIGTALHAAVEADLGTTLAASGWLTDDGYKFWKKRDPEAVKYHVNGGQFFDGMWVSPKQIDMASAILNTVAERENDPDKVMSALAKYQALQDMRRQVPEDAYEAAKLDAMFAIRAYHGSPHDFDRFDMSKIGSGEGAQAFGHGLYFAESEGVAATYRKKLSPQMKGHMYEVQINADPEQFLDWDKPLSQQSDKVRGILGADDVKVTVRRNKNGEYLIAREGVPDVEVFHNGQNWIVKGRGALDGSPILQSISYGSKDEALAFAKQLTGAHVARARAKTPERMAELRDQGILGIRYKDAMSRGTEGGTSNYVVFDDKLITITHKDGKPVTPAEREEIMASIRGVREESRDMRDTLAEARDMERSGATPQAIADATGWAKDGRGHWQYTAQIERYRLDAPNMSDDVGAAGNVDIVEESKLDTTNAAHQAGWALSQTKGDVGRAIRNVETWLRHLTGMPAGQQRALRGALDIMKSGDTSRIPTVRINGDGGAVFSDVKPAFSSGAHGKVKPLTEIIADLKQALGMLSTQGRYGLRVEPTEGGGGRTFRPKANVRGQYDRQSNVSRFKLSTDIEAVAHEGGHMLMERPDLAPGIAHLLNIHAPEIDQFIPAGNQQQGAEGEAFAEWFRHYILSPDEARTRAPHFTAQFEELLDANDPGMLEAIDRVQLATMSADWQAYQNATTFERGRADLKSYADQSFTTKAKEFYKAIGQDGTISGYAHSVYSAALDQYHPWYLAVADLLAVADRNRASNGRENVDGLTLRVHENPYKLIRSIGDSFKTGLRWIQDGMPNYRDRTSRSPSLHAALSLAFGDKWTLHGHQNFGMYLESRRAAEEWRIWNAKQAKLADLSSKIGALNDLRPQLADVAQKLEAKLARQQTGGVRNDTLLRDRQRAYQVAQSELGRVQVQLDRLKDEMAAMQQATAVAADQRQAYIARRQRSIAMAERRQKDLVRQTEALHNEIQEMSVGAAMTGSAVEQLQAQSESARARLANLDTYVRELRAEQKDTRENGMQRRPHRISLEDHEARISQLETANPTFRDAADLVYQFLWQQAVHDHQAGRLSDAQLEYRKTRRHFYVPLARDLSDVEAEGLGPAGAAAAKRFAKDKRFTGSDRNVINPIETIIDQAFHRAAATHFNEVVLALKNLAQNAGPGAAEIAEVVEKSEIVEASRAEFDRIEQHLISLGHDAHDAAEMVRRMEADFTDTQLLLAWSPEGFGPKRPVMVPYWEGGERKLLRINDLEFAQGVQATLSGIGKEMSNLLIDAIAKPASILRMGVTTNPAFIIPNILRDMWSAWILTGRVLDPSTWPMVTQARGLYHEVRQTDMARLYQEVGGLMGGQNVAALSKVRDKADVMALKEQGLHIHPVSLLASAGVGGVAAGVAAGAAFGSLAGPAGAMFGALVGAGIHRGPGKFFENLAHFSDMSETATRLGVFTKAYELALAYNPSLTPYEAAQEAAYVSRDLIDFGRRGSRMLIASRLVPFMNANIQGLDKAVRQLLARSDRGFETSAAKLGAGAAAAAGAGFAVAGPVGAVVGGLLAPTLMTNLQARSEAARRLLAPMFKLQSGLDLSEDERRTLGDSAKAWTNLMLYTGIMVAFMALYRDDDEYKRINAKVKNRAQPVKMFGEWFQIPKAFEWGAPSILMEAAIDAQFKNDPQFWERVADGLSEVLAPPLVPQTVRLWRDIGANFNSLSKRPIVPEYQKVLPPQEQFNAYTSQLGIAISRVVNESRAKKPVEAVGSALFQNKFELTPAIVDYAISSAFGYWGKDFMKASNIGSEGGTGPRSARILEYPLIGTMLGRFALDVNKAADAHAAFYEAMGRANDGYRRAAAGYGHILKTRGEAAANAYLGTLETDDMRAFAVLEGQASGTKRRSSPLHRVDDVLKVVRDMQSDILMERLADSSSRTNPEPIKLAAAKSAEVRDILNTIAAIETENALISTSYKQFKGRLPRPLEPAIEALRASDERVAEQYERRLRRAHVKDEAEVRAEWPGLRAEVLEEWRAANGDRVSGAKRIRAK